MHQFNEEVAWQRLLDIQREAENSRLMAENGPAEVARLVRRIGQLIADLATRSSRQPHGIEESERARHVA